jgi:hypothetical protein
LRSRLSYEDTFRVRVGLGATETTELIVHQDAICPKSRYFEAERGLEDNSVQFDNFRPEIFYAYLHWVYGSKIDCKSMQTGGKDEEFEKPTLLSLMGAVAVRRLHHG